MCFKIENYLQKVRQFLRTVLLWFASNIMLCYMMLEFSILEKYIFMVIDR